MCEPSKIARLLRVAFSTLLFLVVILEFFLCTSSVVRGQKGKESFLTQHLDFPEGNSSSTSTEYALILFLVSERGHSSPLKAIQKVNDFKSDT